MWSETHRQLSCGSPRPRYCNIFTILSRHGNRPDSGDRFKTATARWVTDLLINQMRTYLMSSSLWFNAKTDRRLSVVMEGCSTANVVPLKEHFQSPVWKSFWTVISLYWYQLISWSLLHEDFRSGRSKAFSGWGVEHPPYWDANH